MIIGAEHIDGLRAEIIVMRHAVEELQRAVEAVPNVNYSETLGEIAAAQDRLAQDIDTIASFTGALSPGERLMKELAWARDTALRPAIDRLATAQGEAMTVAQAVRRTAGVVRARAEQRRAVVVFLAAGIVIGLLTYPLAVGPAVEALGGLWSADAWSADAVPTTQAR